MAMPNLAAHTLQAQPMAPQEAEEMHVPGEHTGRIIGRQGATIRVIQELSGAHVDIERENDVTGRRLMRITGTREQIEACKVYLNMKMNGESLPSAPSAGLNPNEMKISIPNNMVGR
jgi:far upstream element-binding protein